MARYVPYKYKKKTTNYGRADSIRSCSRFLPFWMAGLEVTIFFWVVVIDAVIYKLPIDVFIVRICLNDSSAARQQLYSFIKFTTIFPQIVMKGSQKGVKELQNLLPWVGMWQMLTQCSVSFN